MDSSDHAESSLDSTKPKRRRNRRPKACRPCRDRKVRCDYETPCSTCQRRRHVHLCIYDQSPKWVIENRTGQGLIHPSAIHESIHTSSESPVTTSPSIDPAVSQRLDLSVGLSSPSTAHASPIPPGLIDFLDHLSTKTVDIREFDEQTGETVFLGRNCSSAFFKALLSTVDNYELPHNVSVGSSMGLTNRTPLHPFGSLWPATANVTLRDILASLPSTDRCMRYYRAYTHIAVPFVPYLHDVEGFERQLLGTIQLMSEDLEDARLNQRAADLTYDEVAGYALLFAVLAAGCQLADDVSTERILSTRVFVACSFECLRLSNFYVQPTPYHVQTTLLLEYVVANDSNPGVGWTFLAITVRQAEGQGLHLTTTSDNTGVPHEVHHPMWKAIIHMDATLALAFDRRPISWFSPRYNVLSNIQHATELSYFDVINALNCIKLEWQTAKHMDPILRAVEIELYMAKIAQLEAMSKSEASALKSGKCMEAKLQQLVFTLHIEHFKARLYRYGSMARDAPPEKRVHHFKLQEESYALVVETFLILSPLTPIVQVSWDVLFYAVSAALLLAGLQLARRGRAHQTLLRAFLKSLQSSSAKLNVDNPNEISACPFIQGYAVLESIVPLCESMD